MDFDKISIDDGVLLVQMARRAVTEYLSSNKKIINSEFDEKFSFVIEFLLPFEILFDDLNAHHQNFPMLLLMMKFWGYH